MVKGMIYFPLSPNEGHLICFPYKVNFSYKRDGLVVKSFTLFFFFCILFELFFTLVNKLLSSGKNINSEEKPADECFVEFIYLEHFLKIFLIQIYFFN